MLLLTEIEKDYFTIVDASKGLEAKQMALIWIFWGKFEISK